MGGKTSFRATPRRPPDLLQRQEPWAWALYAVGAATLALVLPAYGFRMQGAIGGGDSQQVFEYQPSIQLIPDMLPLSLPYAIGCAVLAAICLIAIRSRPRSWMLPAVAVLCGAAVAHLAAISDEQVRNPSPLPRISNHGSCSFQKAPAFGDPTAPLKSPYGLECGASVLGPAGRDTASAIAGAHQELEHLSGYGLKPRIGVLILQPLAFLGLLLFSYASLRLLMRPWFAVGTMVVIVLVLEIILTAHSIGQMR